MINKQIQLFRLRQVLRDYGVESQEIESIVREANDLISESVDSVVQAAIEDAVSYADEQGALRFAEDIIVDDIGDYKRISSRTGSFIYENPQIHNLPNLLKNAEVSKDGTLYKKIPVGKPAARSSFDVTRAQSNVQAEARKSLVGKNMAKRVSQLNESMTARVQERLKARNIKTSQQPEIRTATSKQDASTQWVIPEKTIDLTDYIENINQNIQQSTDDIIVSVIDSYMKSI
jgi:hypothetical protein